MQPDSIYTLPTRRVGQADTNMIVGSYRMAGSSFGGHQVDIDIAVDGSITGVTSNECQIVGKLLGNLEALVEFLRDPTKFQKLGVDVLVTSTQKALALPPGMAVCTLSQKAYERTASVPNRGCYFDLRSIYDTIQKKDYQYTNTPCVSIMYAMDLQLQRIMQEGVENRFARHEAMAEFVRSWADEYFSVFANRDHLSRTLTVISNTRDIDIAALNNVLIERGMQLGNGYGDLKNKTFRIAHMGELTMDDMRSITSSIVDILKLK